MFQDDSGVQRRIMARGPEGLVIVPSDGEPPRLPEAAPRVSRLELHGQLMCGAATPATDPRLLALRGSIFRMDKAELTQSLRALQRNRLVDARMWADVVSILSR